MPVDQNSDIKAIEEEYQSLCAKLSVLEKEHSRVSAAAEERKRNLRNDLEECRQAGFNPDTLQQDLQRNREVIITKLGVLNADIAEYGEQLKPLVAEIEGK